MGASGTKARTSHPAIGRPAGPPAGGKSLDGVGWDGGLHVTWKADGAAGFGGGMGGGGVRRPEFERTCAGRQGSDGEGTRRQIGLEYGGGGQACADAVRDKKAWGGRTATLVSATGHGGVAMGATLQPEHGEVRSRAFLLLSATGTVPT